jgi:hypothetical protein
MTNHFHSEIGFEAFMALVLSIVVFGVVIPCTFVGEHQLSEEQAASNFTAEYRSQT